ncbi:Carnitine O-acetyltransferase mitochondrial, partial [Spiromyces aspiralis]
KSGSNVEEPKLLRWSVDSRVRQAIEAAEAHAVRMAQSIHLRLGEVAGLGSDYIKKAKVSPDAFVQMALQLAYYRLHGQPCATYETASTRAFLHGRTETIRSCSSESLAFTKAFDDPD